MARYTLVLFVWCISLLLLPHASASEGIDNPAGQVWQKIQGRPNPRVVDDFELLEGFPLLVQGQGISTEATILTAILEYEIGCERAWSVAFRECRARALEETGKTDHEVNDALNAVWPKSRIEREESAVGQMLARKEQWKTSLVRNAYLFELYIQEAHDFMRAIDLFKKEMYLDAVVEKEERASWTKVKEAVDKRIPVILRNGDTLAVAVGYYVDQTTQYIILYDPKQAEYRIATGIENVTESELKSKDPTVQASCKLRMGLRIERDQALQIDSGPMPALVAKSVDQLQNTEALYVYGWQADLTILYPLALKHLGCDKEHRE